LCKSRFTVIANSFTEKDILTVLVFKLFATQVCKTIANRQPIRGAEYRMMIRASIWATWTIALAAVLVVIATDILNAMASRAPDEPAS
jgi:hypothetical protein